METDLLTPKERYSGVVFIGVRKNDVVEFIKVYAESAELAKTLLEDFLYVKGIHPSDFVIVDKGYESVKGKEIISTRTESELSSFLGRLGLKLLSNGILYLQGKAEIYQITSVSKDLLAEIRSIKEKEKHVELKEEPIVLDFTNLDLPQRYNEKLKVLELMQDTLVVNHAQIPLPKVLREVIKGAVRLPRYMESGGITLRLLDKDLHEVIIEGKEEVLVKPPVLTWDSSIDGPEDFEAKKIGENMYEPPIFLKAYKGFLILEEPPVELVQRLLKIKEKSIMRIDERKIRIPTEFTIIVETQNVEKYEKIILPVKIALSPLTNEELVDILRKELGIEVPNKLVSNLSPYHKTFKTASLLVRLFQQLHAKEPQKPPSELLKTAFILFTGEEDEDH